MGIRIVILGNANTINVLRWQQGLVEAGAEVYVLSTHIQTSPDPFILPIMTRRFSFLPDKLRYFLAVPAARRLLAQLNPDLVLGYFVTGYGTVAALSGFHPLVQVTSGDDILISPQRPILGSLVRFNLRQANLVVAWAPHMARAAEALGIAADKIFTLPRGIPLERFSTVIRSDLAPDQPLRLISTRSLYAAYRLDRLIRAIKLLQQAGVACSLTIAGEGPERETLEQLVRELDLTAQVRFVGLVSNDDLGALLAQHTVYISVIESDGVSASLLEAMAVGLLPIVYDNVANRYWVESGENGLLVVDNSPATIAVAIQQVLANPPLRQRAAVENDRILFERGDLRRNSERYLQRFEQLVADYASERKPIAQENG